MKAIVARLIAVLALLVVAACAKPVTRDVVVAGNQSWTDTGFDLVLGKKVTVKATGEVFANATVSGGPDGIPGRPEWAKYNLVPEAQHVALIGKIGEDGTPFLVGAEASFVVQVDGRFFLGPNDKDTRNNRGEFLASVTVR